VSHPDDDVLAGHAIGDDLPAEAALHLAGCPDCSATLDRFRSVGETLDGPTLLVQPPASVWASIEAQISRPGDLLEPPGRVWRGIEAELNVPASDATAIGPEPSGPSGSSRRRRGKADRRLATWPTRIAAGFIGLIVGAGGVVAWQTLWPRTDQVAFTRLAALPDKVGSGTAALDRTHTGDVLTVDVSKIQASSPGFFEVWLLAPDAKKMVSLGNLLGNRTTFTLPAGLDVADYPVVDISIEPYDGNPTHSGDSIVRGQLDVG
jgi:Anti-sigma-K factor rskA